MRRNDGANMSQDRASGQTSRLDDIRNQSNAIRHYTPVGFEKQRAPAMLFHSLHAYFEVCTRVYRWYMWWGWDVASLHERMCTMLPVTHARMCLRIRLAACCRPHACCIALSTKPSFNATYQHLAAGACGKLQP